MSLENTKIAFQALLFCISKIHSQDNTHTRALKDTQLKMYIENLHFCRNVAKNIMKSAKKIDTTLRIKFNLRIFT